MTSVFRTGSSASLGWPPPGEDLVLSKGMTEEERWLRLKALHKPKRKEPLGPGWERGWDAAHKSQKTVGKI